MRISDITAKNTINALMYKAVSADDVTAETTELKKDTFDTDSFFHPDLAGVLHLMFEAGT